MPTLRWLAGRWSMAAPSTSTRPAAWRTKPAMTRSSVVLPQPDGPEQGHDLARLDGERDAVDGDGRAVADRQVVDVQGAPGGRGLR